MTNRERYGLIGIIVFGLLLVVVLYSGESRPRPKFKINSQGAIHYWESIEYTEHGCILAKRGDKTKTYCGTYTVEDY